MMRMKRRNGDRMSPSMEDTCGGLDAVDERSINVEEVNVVRLGSTVRAKVSESNHDESRSGLTLQKPEHAREHSESAA